jgi:FtsZ-binding cell division protein ZapB
MAHDIRLLEELVNKAVDRLKRLAVERDELQHEVDSLRRELDTLNRARASTAEDGSDWEAERSHVTAELRDALGELRGN